MATRRVLLQSVFNTQWPTPPGNSLVAGWQYQDHIQVSTGCALARTALVASLQFSAYSGFTPPPPVNTPPGAVFTPFDAPQAPKVKAAEQQFSVWHSPFFGTQTANFPPPFTAFDAPQALKVPAAQQQFSLFNGQFTAAAAPALPGGGGYDAPQVFVRNFLYQSDFNLNFAPPAVNNTPPGVVYTPFEQPRGKVYPAAEQQFTAWHSPFFGTVTANFPPPFTPFDAPRAPTYAAAQQQYAVEYNTGTIVPPAQLIADLPNTVFDAPQVKPYPAALQMFSADFQQFFGGTPQETEQPQGRWGPDETKEERRRRHKAGQFFQWEEMPDRSEFAPDPVEHPPHEPQKTEDEAAYVRGASPEHLATVINDQLDDEFWDDELLDMAEEFAKAGWLKK